MQEDEQKDAQPLLIWEDRGRANANVGDDSSESDAEDESDISAKGSDTYHIGIEMSPKY